MQEQRLTGTIYEKPAGGAPPASWSKLKILSFEEHVKIKAYFVVLHHTTSSNGF